MALAPKDIRLANLVGFDVEVFSFLKERTGKRGERACGMSKDLMQVPIDGLSFRVEDGDEAERIMNKIQPVLLAKGYRAYWSTRKDANGLRRGDEVIVLKTRDHFGIVKSQRTDGANYNVSNRAVLARLRGWEQRCRFTIVGASQDWVALVFQTLPKDLCRFAEEVYRLCPDTVEQGVGLMRESEHPGAFAAARRLCPQLSGDMQKQLDKERKQADKRIANADSKWRVFAEAYKKLSKPFEEISTEMGIKLLAYEMKKTKYLFLWWD
jgi:hypothetical protein